MILYIPIFKEHFLKKYQTNKNTKIFSLLKETVNQGRLFPQNVNLLIGSIFQYSLKKLQRDV